MVRCSGPAYFYFNPRSPHGERLLLSGRIALLDLISTHAPRTGSDKMRHTSAARLHLFQPTLPARGATLPAIGETVVITISTHAPRTGSDAFLLSVGRGPAYFNPRSPHGERPRSFFLSGVARLISTHAPRTGSDFCRRLPAPRGQYFNPRSPHGERPDIRRQKEVTHDFNPRSPHGERQRKVTILSIRIIGFAQKVYHKTVLLRISLAENAVILPEKP